MISSIETTILPVITSKEPDSTAFTTSAGERDSPRKTSVLTQQSDKAWGELLSLARATVKSNHHGSKAATDDLEQDVFLALGPRMTNEAPENLRGLVVTIAKCLCMNWHRRLLRTSKRRVPWSGQFEKTLVILPCLSTVDVAEALALMADDTREVFVALAFEGFSQSQAAEKFGITRHSVRSLYAEARDFLRRLWGKCVENKSVEKHARP